MRARVAITSREPRPAADVGAVGEQDDRPDRELAARQQRERPVDRVVHARPVPERGCRGECAVEPRRVCGRPLEHADALVEGDEADLLPCARSRDERAGGVDGARERLAAHALARVDGEHDAEAHARLVERRDAQVPHRLPVLAHMDGGGPGLCAGRQVDDEPAGGERHALDRRVSCRSTPAAATASCGRRGGKGGDHEAEQRLTARSPRRSTRSAAALPPRRTWRRTASRRRPPAARCPCRANFGSEASGRRPVGRSAPTTVRSGVDPFDVILEEVLQRDRCRPPSAAPR